jgi:hypothetical protein
MLERNEEREKAKARLMTRIWAGVTVLAVALAVGVLSCGCGAKSDQSVAAAQSEPSYPVTQPAGAMAVPASAITSGVMEQPAVTADSLPPDVAVSVDDTQVLAGVPIEITAEGSPDVVTVTLSDGIHQKQVFTRDSSDGSWRTLYRVPLKLSEDRLGLAITAKNGAGRWRRVWVFLQPLSEKPAPMTQDTTAHQ